MRIQKTNNYNNSFRADVKILGDKRILSKQDIAFIKTEARKYKKVNSIVINIGELDHKNQTRKTTIDAFVNGLEFRGLECNKLFDVDIRNIIIQHFKDLNKPIK